MNDLKGVNSNKWPSVSKVLHKYHEEFPTEEASFKKARGDKEIQKKTKEWSDMADYANNIGSRALLILEE
jgi:hypothetical protein